MRLSLSLCIRLLALLLMPLALTGAAATSAAASLQTVPLTAEICATLDADNSGGISETEAQALVDLGFNLAGDEATVIDQADFDAAMTGCADLLAGAATPTGNEEYAAHPAHIHSGTCEELGDVVYPLNDVAPVDFPVEAGTPAAMSSPVAEGRAMASEGVVADSVTTVDTSLDDLLSGEYAINAHESAVNIQNYIACGNITGETTDGQLTVELHELNDSGYTGEAVLVDNGDGTTTVTLTLMQGGAGMMEATPAS